MVCKISLAFIHLIALALIDVHIPHIYSQDTSQDYLNAHNAARAEVGVGPITWDNTVAAYAKNYANQRIDECKLVHSGGPYGENIAWGSGNLSGTDAVEMWVGEKVDFNPTSNTCAAGKVCGHYTQVVWRNSVRVGCAKVRCNDGGTFISCNYDPPGNNVGQRPYALADTPAPAASPFMPNEYAQDYLNAHNAARAEVSVGPITWDNTVAAYAQDYANQRIGDCNLVHSGGPYGENIARSSGDLSGTNAVKMWVGEKVDFNPTSNTCAAGKVCRHYTQVVWQATDRLGCAKVRCNNGGTLISCNYDPPGNKVGHRPYALAATPAPAASPFLPPSSESVIPNVPSVPLNKLLTKGGKKIGLAAGLTAGACAMIFGLCFSWLILRWKLKQNKNDHILDTAQAIEFENVTGPRKFSHAELGRITNNFGGEGKLGEGGFGSVFKGFLSDVNIFVAVKKISSGSKQGSKEYQTEVKIISQLRHKNTVKLVGWCHEKELMLVYEFMPNGSLDSHIFKGKSLLTWEMRYKIVQDVALALLYLHEEGDHCVLHRDIKSSNIMLDSDFNAKLGDFGLARLVDHAKGSQTTGLAGTVGYMAPECLTAISKASKKSDIYSFGVVALEIACGRRSIEQNYAEEQVSLVPWVWEAYGNRRLLDIADNKLCMNFDINQMECLMIVGLWCAHPDRNLRPLIRQVIQVLNFELPLPSLPPNMPVFKFEIPRSTIVTSQGREIYQSLTIPR